MGPKEKDDPVLGRIRRCSTCGEWWPADREFFYSTGRAADNRLHSRCKACYEEWRKARRQRERETRQKISQERTTISTKGDAADVTRI